MARLFFSRAGLSGPRAVIIGQELHHLRNVLRLREGDPVALFDESGQEYQGTITRLSAAAAEVTLVKPVSPSPESSVALILAQARLKKPKMDLVVEKATELGASRIIPFLSAHTVVRPTPERLNAQRERWRRIALNAAKQSGRTLIDEITSLPHLDGKVAPDALKILFWEKERTHSLKDLVGHESHPSSLFAVVGPEGGFAPEEIRCPHSQGFHTVGLSHRILRAETAAIVALALCQFLWNDL